MGGVRTNMPVLLPDLHLLNDSGESKTKQVQDNDLFAANFQMSYIVVKSFRKLSIYLTCNKCNNQ